MTPQQRIRLYRHLSGQMRNGIPLIQSLLFFSRRGDPEGKRKDELLLHVIGCLKDGKSLGTAFRDALPVDEILLLESGETSGDLPAILDLLVQSIERQDSVVRSLREATAAPLVYLASTLLMLWIIGVKVLPSLQTVLPVARATGLVAMLYGLGALVQNGWVLATMLVLFFTLPILLFKSFPRWCGENRIKAESFFPYNVYRDLQGYYWLTGFSTLLSSGVNEVQILRRQKERASPWLRERLSHLILNLENGKSLGAALQSRGPGGLPRFGFPHPDLVDEMVSMDGHRDFASKLCDLRNRWSEELGRQLQSRSRRFGFWLEMMLFGCMGWLMLAINELSMQIGSVSFK